MSSSQAQRQERLQARLRGAGTTAFAAPFSFAFDLPQEPSPARDNAPAPLPQPAESAKGPTPRRETPPTRASPRLSAGPIETPIQRSTRSSSRLSDTAASKQQSVRSSVGTSSGQKRKRTEITNNETPIQRAGALVAPTETPILPLTVVSTTTPTEPVTPQTRGQERRQSPPGRYLTPDDGIATRLFGMDTGGPSDRFDSLVQENRFKSLVDEAGEVEDEDENQDEMMLDAKSLLEDILGADVEGIGEEEEDDTIMENAWEKVEEEGEVEREGNIEEQEEKEVEEGDEEEQEVEVEGTGEEEEEEEEEQEAEGDREPFLSSRASGKHRRSTIEASQELEEEPERQLDDEEEVEEEEAGEEAGDELEEEVSEEVSKAVEEKEGLPEYDEAPEPTPKTALTSKSQNNVKKPPPPQPQKVRQAKPKPKPIPKKQKPDRRQTIEITVHRLSKSKTKQPQASIPAITPLDVLSQIFKETLKRQYGKLDSSVAKLALEVFADEVEVRMLEHTDTLNTTLQTARELRKYQKVQQDKREQLMALRQELGKVELEIDEVRRRHERESRESKNKHHISQRLETIAATQELHRARAVANPTHTHKMEGEIDLLLRKLTGQVTSSRRKRTKLKHSAEDELDDLDEDEDIDEIFDEEMGGGGDGLETGSILERVRGFNRYLERAERVIREANTKRVAGERRW